MITWIDFEAVAGCDGKAGAVKEENNIFTTERTYVYKSTGRSPVQSTSKDSSLKGTGQICSQIDGGAGHVAFW